VLEPHRALWYRMRQEVRTYGLLLLLAKGKSYM